MNRQERLYRWHVIAFAIFAAISALVRSLPPHVPAPSDYAPGTIAADTWGRR